MTVMWYHYQYLFLIGLATLQIACTPSQEPSVLAYLRGSNQLILRIPNAGQPSEDIIISDTEPTEPKSAVRSLVSDTEYNSIAYLTEDAWNDVQDLYRSWCQTAPHFSTQTPYYTVGIRCGIRVVEIHIPHNELPAPLVRLNHIVPPVRHMVWGSTPTPREGR